MNLSWIVPLQTKLTIEWHNSDAPDGIAGAGIEALVERHHLGQFKQWHEEDLTRNVDQSFEIIAKAKWRIDHLNQERHNMVEAIDQWIVDKLKPVEKGCPRNSETLGSMIDRLSILVLKEYHMREQSQRIDADDSHRARCVEKLTRIIRQKYDLAGCLEELAIDVAAGRRTYFVNYQFKMYNDPAYKVS